MCFSWVIFWCTPAAWGWACSGGGGHTSVTMLTDVVLESCLCCLFCWGGYLDGLRGWIHALKRFMTKTRWKMYVIKWNFIIFSQSFWILTVESLVRAPFIFERGCSSVGSSIAHSPSCPLAHSPTWPHDYLPLVPCPVAHPPTFPLVHFPTRALERLITSPLVRLPICALSHPPVFQLTHSLPAAGPQISY